MDFSLQIFLGSSAKTADKLWLGTTGCDCEVGEVRLARALSLRCKGNDSLKGVGMFRFTGLPSDEIYKRVTRALKLQERPVIIVLDEIDFVVKNDKDILLYELTRLKHDLDVKVSLIGLSNDIRFKEMLDPRVVSSLCEIEMVFSPYTTV